jgi:hypothetical protein
MTSRRPLDLAVAAAVVAGVVARGVRYVDARSLWNDEAQLALNIWGRAAGGLLEPLDFGQSAPYGFLLLERAVLVAFGPGELALRAVPLLASLAAIPLLLHVARRVLPKRDAQIALGLFALCEPLVFYASELKQYSFDVLVMLGLLALALRTQHAPLDRRAAFTLAAAGAVGLWLSHPAAFACAAIGAGLALRAVRQGGAALPLVAAIGVVWLASFAALYELQLAAALQHPYLREFWSGGFAPMPPRSLDELLWYPRTLAGFFADPVGLSPWWLGLALAGLGAWRLSHSEPLASWWLAGPLAIGVVASTLELYPLRTWPPVDASARLYPFAGRLWLFAVPAALLWVARGVGALGELSGRWADAVLTLALLAVAAVPGWTLVRNAWDPPPVQEFRPIADQLRDRAAPGDLFWVQRGSEPTFEYYARLLGLAVRARNVGTEPPERREALERDLAALAAGERVWLVALDHPAWTGPAERSAIEARLRSRAHEVDRLEAHAASAVAFLVDGEPR